MCSEEPHMADNNLMTETELAKMLDLRTGTLRIWRIRGKGPKFTKVGAYVRYRREVVEAWLAANEFSSTAECSDARASA
jgi:hypothetical protein